MCSSRSCPTPTCLAAPGSVLLHETDARGFQIFNPGRATVRRRAPHHTMGLARSSAGGVQFELIALE